MNIKCEKKVLIDAINTVSKAVPARTVLELLKGVKLTAEEGKLTLIATDLNMTIIKSIEVDVVRSGEVVVPAKLFADVVRSMPNDSIVELDADDTAVVVKTDKLNFKVARYANDSEFPNVFSEDDVQTTVTMNCDVFESLVKETAFAASYDDSKGILTGLLIEISPNNTKLVGVDGFRLALSQGPFGEGNVSFVVNALNLLEVAKIAQAKYGSDVTVDILDRTVIFSFDDTKAIARRLEGEFINYESIIPKSGTTNIAVNKTALKESLLRATLLAREGKHNLIKCEIEDDKLTISARSEVGELREEISIEHTDANLTIGFNSKYILDALNAISDDHAVISIAMNKAIDPCVIRPKQGDEFEYMVLPVRI